MPIIKGSDAERFEAYPGIDRVTLVDKKVGASSLTVGQLTMSPGSSVGTHIHPRDEEAMVVLEGTLEAVFGDRRVTVEAGTTVLAPPGVKHGFVNRSNQPATLMFIFPTVNVERVPVE